MCLESRLHNEHRIGGGGCLRHEQPIPTESGKNAEAPVALLLTDQQIRMEPRKVITFSELAMKIQKPEGLAAGNISIPWDPATDTVTVKSSSRHAREGHAPPFRPV